MFRAATTDTRQEAGRQLTDRLSKADIGREAEALLEQQMRGTTGEALRSAGRLRGRHEDLIAAAG
jgi:hypothetical protein